MAYNYSTAIRIHDFEGVALGNGNTIADAKRAKGFVDNVSKALDGLYKLGTGRKLIDEIDTSGKTVDIFLACSGKDGCAMTSPANNFAAQYSSQIVPFRPFVRNLEIGQRDRTANKGTHPDNWAQTPTKAEAYYEKEVVKHLGASQTDKSTAPEFDALIKRAAAKYGDVLRVMGQLTGKSTVELFQMAKGVRPMDDSTYYKICVYFYEFLTPGPGCNTQVRLQYEVGLTGTDGKTRYKKDASAVDPRVMAGHELIHAWRMMNGRRLVRSGWEEEAMTVGLGFAAGWPMTENRLRQEAGHPRRSSYSGMTDVSSHWASQWKSSSVQ